MKSKPGVRVQLLAVITILCALCLTQLRAGEASLQTSPQAQAELDAVNRAIATIQDWLLDANASYTTAEATLRDAELRIMTTMQAITNVENELERTQVELAQLQGEAASLEAAKSRQHELMQHLLRAAYMRGDQSLLKLLLNQEEAGKSARMLQYYRFYSESRIAALQEFQSTLDAIAATNTLLQDSAAALTAQQVELQNLVDTLELDRETRRVALLELQTSIAARNTELEQLQIDQLQLEQLIDKINRAIEQIPLPADSSPFSTRRGELPPPVAGNVVQGYGSTYGDGNLRRQGMFIVASEGAQVRAVHAGRVVFANWLRGAGLLLIVDHGDGYMSLYGNNEALAKTAGESVRAGETIATAGSSGGSDISGLHFEIRHHGAAQDPADWLQNR